MTANGNTDRPCADCGKCAAVMVVDSVVLWRGTKHEQRVTWERCVACRVEGER